MHLYFETHLSGGRCEVRRYARPGGGDSLWLDRSVE
jgi:hypothetical protein